MRVRTRKTLRLIVAEAVAVAINILPLGLWYFEDYSAQTAMLVYALEAAAAILLTALCILIVSPAQDPDGAKYKVRGKLIGDFLVVSLPLVAVVSLFIVAFIYVAMKSSIEFSAAGSACLIVLAFQLAAFLTDTLTLRPLPLRRAEFVLTRSLGKAALLFVCVFIGIFLATIVNEWFVVPFVVLKTMVDVVEPVQFFLGVKETGVPLNGLEYSSTVR